MEVVKIKGVGVYPFSSMNELVSSVKYEKKLLLSVNAEILMNSTIELKEILNSNICYCDGIGAVIAVKSRTSKKVVKIPGCELWLKIVAENYRDSTFYLVGSTKNIIESVVSKLKSEYEGINILGYRDGFLTCHDMKLKLIDDIKSKKPDFVFVAMGFPRQELLMNELYKHHEALYMGLGGSFDVYTGTIKRAPRFYQKMGLEWMYRLFLQPSRIMRQLSLFKFALHYFLGKY